MAKKSIPLKSAEKLDDFVQKYNESRTYIRTVLQVPLGETKQSVLIELRKNMATGKPAKFHAEFDGKLFCLTVKFGAEATSRIVEKLEFTKLPDATQERALALLKKAGLA